MKKLLAIALSLLLTLCAASAFAEAAPASFTLTLTANPTTGYDWQYDVGEDGIVTVEQEVYTVADADKLAEIEPTAEPISGEGSLYVYTVKGVKPGTVLIAFEYGQSWDDESTVVGAAYELVVNDDLSVTCIASTLGV